MKVKYIGPFKSVEIAAIRQFVERGKTIDVPTDIGRSLIKQSSWKRVQTKKKPSITD